jgi:predicted ribosome quality control (RQC) complex YloA/Tae2 family protein
VNEAAIAAVCDELRPELIGRRTGKIFPLSARRLAIDFRLNDQRYLFISTEPNAPRIYLIRRRLKDLEKQTINPSPFHLLLKKHLSGCELRLIEKIPHERILRFEFAGENDAGEQVLPNLVVQLTGKSANLFLLDRGSRILASLSDSEIEGQRIGERYSAPIRSVKLKDRAEVELEPGNREASLSEALDVYYTEKDKEARFRSQANAALKKLQSEIARRRKLIERLRSDLESHGDAEKWKKYGDLLLANLSTAKRKGGRAIVTDYFDAGAPQIEIEADENLSLTQAAEKYFKRYTKAHNAAREIERRLETVAREIRQLEVRLAQSEKAAAEWNESFFDNAIGQTPKEKKEKRRKDQFTGARKFVSSDGFEILVGKRAVDNDQLTFRVAGSLDLWLHAADYPGSHVVIRNPNRKEVPQRTLLEAAQLAAFYSSGKSQPKAAVHYTQKKFVNKPKGAAPGLVRLASFKTILVEPIIPPAIDKKQ